MSKNDKMTSQTSTVQPQPETETNAAPGTDADADIVHFEGRKGGHNAFAAFNAKRTETVQRKVQLLQNIDSKLDEAAKLAKQSGTTDSKAEEIAADAGRLIVEGRVAGILSADEATDKLGSKFGWKVKPSTGEQSKTPFGLGEVLRKRINRCVAAYDYAINGNEPVAFFEPLERDDVAPLVRETLQGKRSLWDTYNQLAEMKAEATGKRPKAAFDPRRIAALTRDIGANIAETVKIVNATPGLFAAYAGLLAMLNTVGNEMPADDEAEAEAA